jgi:hypothetical protein
MCSACFQVQYHGIYHKEYFYAVQLLLRTESKTLRFIEVCVFKGKNGAFSRKEQDFEKFTIL